jgi:hypothetical protein
MLIGHLRQIIMGCAACKSGLQSKKTKVRAISNVEEEETDRIGFFLVKTLEFKSLNEVYKVSVSIENDKVQ